MPLSTVVGSFGGFFQIAYFDLMYFSVLRSISQRRLRPLLRFYAITRGSGFHHVCFCNWWRKVDDCGETIARGSLYPREVHISEDISVDNAVKLVSTKLAITFFSSLIYFKRKQFILNVLCLWKTMKGIYKEFSPPPTPPTGLGGLKVYTELTPHSPLTTLWNPRKNRSQD